MPRQPAPRVTEPLFADEPGADSPLAARMRPRTLEEFVGQDHLVGPDGALSKVVRPGYLPSIQPTTNRQCSAQSRKSRLTRPTTALRRSV